MKKIIAVAKVLNESDIIESFVRYNLTYCDGILIYEGNRSFDNTAGIIRNLMSEGLPVYSADNIADKGSLRDVKDYLSLHVAMAHKAIGEYGADLVVPLDADEFLYQIDGVNPREALEAMSEDVEYQAIWRTYVYEKEPDIKLGFLPNNFTRYRNPEMESPDRYDRHKKVIVSKYLLKDKQATVAPGSHFLVYPEEHKNKVKTELHNKLVFAHFPVRSKVQIMRKVIPNWIFNWTRPHRMPRDLLDVIQTGLPFNGIRDSGEMTSDEIRLFSLEYAMFLDHSKTDDRVFFSREDIDKLKSDLGVDLTVLGLMNISFCAEKLDLRYTDYSEDNRTFIRATLTEIDKAVTYLSSESDDRARQISEVSHHNIVLTQQNAALTQENADLTHHNITLTHQHAALYQQNTALTQESAALTQQNTALNQQSAALSQQNTALAQQISDIYNSRTWKMGKCLQKMYRIFVPRKG